MSNDLVLRETGLRQVTCIVRERQQRLYGHIAHLHPEDPAHQILPCRDPEGWTTPRGRPHASCLRQVESYLNIDRVYLVYQGITTDHCHDGAMTLKPDCP